jgi:predicted phage terminase large subunit-like protein
VIVATRYHKDDLVGRLLREQTRGGDQWKVISFPAFAELNDPLGRNEGEALWPEKWSAEYLEREQNSIAISGYPWIFEALYQQQPPDIIDTEFPSEYFGDHIWFDESDYPRPQDITNRVIYVDPSMGKSDKSDYSAIIMIAVDIGGKFWIDADIQRRPASRIVEDAIGWHSRFRPEALGCETNAFQELLGPMLQAEAIRQGEDVFYVGASNAIDKKVRIRRLTPHLAYGDLRFKRNSPGVNLLLEQLRGFPSHKHDDGPDALAGAVKLAKDIMSGEVFIHDSNESNYINP